MHYEGVLRPHLLYSPSSVEVLACETEKKRDESEHPLLECSLKVGETKWCECINIKEMAEISSVLVKP